MSASSQPSACVTLASLADEHIPAVLTACADWKELATHGPPYWRPRSPAELRRKIAATSGHAVASEYSFVIRDDGKLVGECSLHAIDWRNRVAQVGICIWDPADRGNGYGRLAATQLITWAYQHLDLSRLEAWILANNTASLTLFESMRFVREGVLRQRYVHHGHRLDIEVLGRVAQGGAI